MASTKQYIERTRGSITSSKLKDFMLCPELYKLKYVDEFIPPELEDEDDKDHFTMGRATEELIYYGPDWFSEHYSFDEKKYVKEDYATMIAKEDYPEKTDEELRAMVKEMMKPKNYTAVELQAEREKRHQDDRIYLTPAQYRDVLGMYREVIRQPLFMTKDEGFVNQYYVECKYGSLKLSGTLDRYSREKKQIRDRKTSGRIDRAERDIENTYDYITQMAFYYVLVYVSEGVECDVYLDVIGSKSPYVSFPYRVGNARMHIKMMDELKPALDRLIECHGNNDRPTITTNMEKLRKSPYYPYLQTTINSSYIGEF